MLPPEIRNNPNARANSYKPNRIPLGKRKECILFALILFLYGCYGIWENDLFIPARRGKGIHLHDLSLWVAFAAIICACCNLLLVIADHYDKRDNEEIYAFAARVLKYTAFSLIILAICLK